MDLIYLQYDPESGDSDGDVQQVGGEKEVVVVAQDGEDEVPELVQEGLKNKEGRYYGKVPVHEVSALLLSSPFR